MIEITRGALLNLTLYAVLLACAAAAILLGHAGHITAGAWVAGTGLIGGLAWHAVMVLFSPAITRWCNEPETAD